MSQFPKVSGLLAPSRLPTASRVVAQPYAFGGSYVVTLVAEDARSGSTGGGADLGTYATTPAHTAAGARASVARTGHLQHVACVVGPVAPSSTQGSTVSPWPPGVAHVHIGSVKARACPAAGGEVLSWRVQAWSVQVRGPRTTAELRQAAGAVARWATPGRLPEASDGVLDVALPGSGTSDLPLSSSLTWAYGSDVYVVRSSQGVLAAGRLAASLRPWPATPTRR